MWFALTRFLQYTFREEIDESAEWADSQWEDAAQRTADSISTDNQLEVIEVAIVVDPTN